MTDKSIERKIIPIMIPANLAIVAPNPFEEALIELS
jgi:hypothetical protein